jgi:hypothetical protein
LHVIKSIHIVRVSLLLYIYNKQILPGTFEYILNYLIDLEPGLHDPQHEKDSTLWVWICVTIRENGSMPLK